MKPLKVAKGIISPEQAESYGWLEDQYDPDFLERYNESQKNGAKPFACYSGENLPKFLVGANFTRADLRDADLRDADLTRADLTNANIDLVSILKETDELNGVDFTYIRLRGDKGPFPIGKEKNEAITLIINRLVDLKITNAKGLGEDYESALISAGLTKSEEIIEKNSVHNKTASEIELAPSLAGAGFSIAAYMPTEKQLKEEAVIDRPLTNDYDM